MTIGIYKITNNVNGKCYIGKSKNIEARYEGHFKAALVKNMQSKFYTAIRKYGKSNFNLQILHILDTIDEDELNRLEILEIKAYNSFGENGYNMTPGGDGVTQLSEESLIKMKEKLRQKIPHNKGVSGVFKHSEEAKEKIRISSTGRKHSEASIKMMRDKQSGDNHWIRNISKEEYDNHILKLKNAHAYRKGSKLSCEVKRKISESLKKSHSMKEKSEWRKAQDEKNKLRYETKIDIYDSNKNFICTLDNIDAAAIFIKADPKSVSRCCRKNIDKVKGFITVYSGEDVNEKRKCIHNKRSDI